MANNIVLKCERLGKRFGSHQAVSDISFSLNRGQIVGLLGLNGAGKTTTLSMLCGVLPPDSGYIEICGHSLRELPIKSKQHIGFLPDQLPLYRELTVSEYLTYCAQLRRVPRGNQVDSVKKSIERCGLKGRENQLVGQLSRGYQQRVAISQAIVHEPSVIVLDEPTSGLDPVQITQIRDLILDLGKNHSVIISTHLLFEAELLCDRILIIHNGSIVLDKMKTEITKDSSSVIVTFNNPPSIDELQSVNNIEGAVELGNNKFRVSTKSNNYDELLKQSVAASWHLTELSTVTSNIESVFITLTKETK